TQRDDRPGCAVGGPAGVLGLGARARRGAERERRETGDERSGGQRHGDPPGIAGDAGGSGCGLRRSARPAFVRGGTYGPWVRRTWLALAPGATGPTRARGDRPSVARPGADAGRWAASDRSEEGRRDDDDEWVGSRTGGAGPARAGFRGPQAGDERRLRGPRHGTRRGDRIRGDP